MRMAGVRQNSRLRLRYGVLPRDGFGAAGARPGIPPDCDLFIYTDEASRPSLTRLARHVGATDLICLAKLDMHEMNGNDFI